MKKKKLVTVLGGFGIGGAEHMVYELVKNLDTDLFAPHILCTESPQNTTLEKQVEAICPVEYVEGKGRVDLKRFFRVVRALGKMKPDVVHAHMGGVGFAAPWTILHRKAFVVTVHTKPEKSFSPKIMKVVKAALRLGKTKLVAVSEDNRIKVKEYFKLSDKKCGCVNNGIDIDRFFRAEHENYTLINVARQDENKNQAALIRCFARLHKEHPDTRLLLLGDGDTHQALMRQVDEIGLSHAITFTSNVPNTEDYYAVSDLYVQTSHNEAMPLSVLEAMATGLPIVSTDVGGLRDVVKDNGALVPDNDEEALYQSILGIYRQSAEETKRMSEASLRMVEEYSSEHMARAYEKIYQEML